MMKKMLIWLMALVLCVPCAVAEEKDNRYDALGYYYHENGLLPVQRNGLWGVIAADGTLIIPCEWERLGGKWSTPHDECEIVRAVRGSEVAWFSQQGQNITGRIHDRETTTGCFDWHHLYLLEDGVLTIWNAEGEQVY